MTGMHIVRYGALPVPRPSRCGAGGLNPTMISVCAGGRASVALLHSGVSKLTQCFPRSRIPCRAGLLPPVHSLRELGWVDVIGSHGTRKKCKVRIAGSSVPALNLDARAFTPDELRDGRRPSARARSKIHRSSGEFCGVILARPYVLCRSPGGRR
jgi:hypothetical protein